MAHGGDKGVYGAAVFEISYEINVQVFQCALGLIDGV